MSSLALIGAAVSALIDWWAVTVERRRVELVAKPLTMVLAIVAALAVEPADDTVRTLVVLALVASLVGDVVLMLPTWPFLAGLGAFLVAHVAYIAAFAAFDDGSLGWWRAGMVVVAIALASVAPRLITAVRSRGSTALTVGVVAYVVVISVMVVFGFGTGVALVAAAVVAFYVSDTLLGWDRFVRPIRHAKLLVHSTYHLAQLGFVLWLLLDA